MEKCKVLIVDDELLIRQGIKHYVQWEEEGFEIVGEANNGEEALELIPTTTPHIVITDIVMPIMDGEELTRIIKSDYPDIQVIILSSFSDFEYVRSTFQNGVSDYILKPTLNGEDLLKALKKAVNLIPNFQLHSKNNDDTMTTEQLVNRLLNEQLSTFDQAYIDTHFTKEQFLLLHIHPIKRGNKEELDQQLREQLPLIYERMIENIYLLHLNSYEVEQVLNKLKALASKYNGFNWTIGSPFSNIHAFKSKYEEELLPLLEKRFYFPDQQLLIAESIQNKEKGPNQTFDLDHFIRLFKHEQFTDAFSYLEQFIDYITKNQTMESREFKSFLGNIMFNMTVLLANLNYENEQLEKKKYQYLHDVSEVKNVQEGLGIYRAFVDDVKQIIVKKQGDDSDIMKEILNYIQVHYQEPLTLTEIAEHFHFNSSYLSTYFSSNYRIGLNDYINELRMTKAKQLLTESTYKISDISGEVGYSDHSYFCKVFKQEMGVSPSQYRRKHKRK